MKTESVWIDTGPARPCHGSRFSPEGEVLQGPAVHGLEQKLVGREPGSS